MGALLLALVGLAVPGWPAITPTAGEAACDYQDDDADGRVDEGFAYVASPPADWGFYPGVVADMQVEVFPGPFQHALLVTSSRGAWLRFISHGGQPGPVERLREGPVLRGSGTAVWLVDRVLVAFGVPNASEVHVFSPREGRLGPPVRHLHKNLVGGHALFVEGNKPYLLRWEDGPPCLRASAELVPLKTNGGRAGPSRGLMACGYRFTRVDSATWTPQGLYIEGSALIVGRAQVTYHTLLWNEVFVGGWSWANAVTRAGIVSLQVGNLGDRNVPQLTRPWGSVPMGVVQVGPWARWWWAYDLAAGGGQVAALMARQTGGEWDDPRPRDPPEPRFLYRMSEDGWPTGAPTPVEGGLNRAVATQRGAFVAWREPGYGDDGAVRGVVIHCPR